MDAPLRGRVAVVTGASRGIGAAIAEGYARAGAAVVGIARSREHLALVGRRIQDAEGEFEAVVGDVTDEPALTAAFEVAVGRHGGVDVVVANAGIVPERSEVADAGLADWRAVMETNVVGVASTIRVAVPHLRGREGARIITIGSGLGRQGLPGLGVYASSKAALTRLTQVAAAELAPVGIAVNELIPGPVVTGEDAERDAVSVVAVYAGEWEKRPEDVVPLALYLATQPSPGPTGQTFSLMRR